ncbi:MAG TPA: methyltransferase domain-containing protein, partial [Parachlamydiaceae bacterium]|nr:methyltransferase domain-containing protein [Parachlamydiaceae bacterium]
MYRPLGLFIYSIFLFTEIFADQWDGTDYAQNSSIQLSHAERFLLNLSLRGDEKILDIGCGDGKITAHLSKRVPQGFVIGIDPSVSMLTIAQDMLKQNDYPNLTFCEGAAENFSLNECFDHITAFHAMHWVKDQETALRNIHAHLKPKGHVHFILAPSKEGLPFYNALQKTYFDWVEEFKGFVNPQQVFDMETYRKLMAGAGFHVEAIHYVYHEFIHENKEKLKAWIKQWLPYGKHLTPKMQDIFMDDLINSYLK